MNNDKVRRLRRTLSELQETVQKLDAIILNWNPEASGLNNTIGRRDAFCLDIRNLLRLIEKEIKSDLEDRK